MSRDTSELDRWIREYPDQVEAVNYIFNRWRREESSDNGTDERIAKAVGLNRSTVWSIRKGKRRGGLSTANRVRLNRAVAGEGRQAVLQTQHFYRKQRYTRRLEIRGWVTEKDAENHIQQLQREIAKEINRQILDPEKHILPDEIARSFGIADGGGGELLHSIEKEIASDKDRQKWWENPDLEEFFDDFPWDTP